MKIIFICLFIFINTGNYNAFSQNKKLLLINSAKADTATFEIGDRIKIRVSGIDYRIGGRLNEINDSSILVDRNRVSLESIQFIREKLSPGLVIVKTIGGTIAVLGAHITFLIAALHPYPSSEDPNQQLQYQEDLQEFKKALIISGSITVFAASAFLIHNPKYIINKGWQPSVFSPVELPKPDSASLVESTGIDSTKKSTDQPKLNPRFSFSPNNTKLSNNAAYFQFSKKMTGVIFYDHLWEFNKSLNLSTGIGLGEMKYSKEYIIPVSLGCVIGKQQHRLEIAQMTWVVFNNSNPSLLGILAYRFQSYQGQIFVRGGALITELSNYKYDHSIHPFLSIGIGF